LEVDIEKACLDYETELSRLLKITGAISPPYAAVSTSAILERCLAGRRPFSSDGKKGFRDAVIWESLVEIIKTPSKTIFITSNTSDFGAHRKLHESLCEDIAGSGKSLIVCDGIEKFAEEFAKPALKILDGIKPRVEDGGFLSDLLHQVVQELNATDQVRGTLRGDIGSASIENMPVLDNEVGDVYDLGNGLLSCSVSYSGHVDVLIVESEYEGPYEPPSHHAGVLSARLETTVEITFRTVGNDEMKLMSFEVDDVQLDFND
jgi:hypothetical protein